MNTMNCTPPEAIAIRNRGQSGWQVSALFFTDEGDRDVVRTYFDCTKDDAVYSFTQEFGG